MSPFPESFFPGVVDTEALDQTVASAIRYAAEHPVTLYLFFHRYTYFNGYVATLIARLASSIGLSRYLFVDTDQVVIESADRGMEIAANVLAAAADEGANGGVCHRSLAQLTLNAIGGYADLSVQARNQFAPVPAWLDQIVQSVIAEYPGTPNDRASLMRSLGFHAASEFLGDRENALIDRVIRLEKKATGFDRYMNQHKGVGTINGHSYHPWAYILIHGKYNGEGAEAEHFRYALKALNLSAKYQDVTVEQLQAWVVEGFQAFVALQQQLFQCIEQECRELMQRTTTLGPNRMQAIGLVQA